MGGIVLKLEDTSPFVRYIRYLDVDKTTKFELFVAYDARMFYTLDGTGCIVVNGTEYIMNTSSVLIIAPGIPYQISSLEDGAAKYIAVNFDYTQDFSHLNLPVHLSRILSFKHSEILRKSDFEDVEEFNGILYIPNIKKIEKHLVKAEYEYSHKVICCRTQVNAYFSHCLANCVRSLTFNDFFSQNANYKTEKVLTYIHEHYNENLTNKKLGEIFSFHPNYLNHMIKTHTGSSLHQYILHIQIMNAARLLEEGQTSVAEAAEKTGFCDISTFSKHFKRIMGETPIRYKNKLV